MLNHIKNRNFYGEYIKQTIGCLFALYTPMRKTWKIKFCDLEWIASFLFISMYDAIYKVFRMQVLACILNWINKHIYWLFCKIKKEISF